MTDSVLSGLASAESTAGVDPILAGLGSGTLIILLVFVPVGLLLIYDGFHKWQQLRLIEDTPTEKVRSAAAGRTELSGTAKPIDGVGTIEQPFAEGEALVVAYEIEEERESSSSAGIDWKTIESETLCVPFELDDGTGQMRVEPDEDATYEIAEDNQTDIEVWGNQSPPDRVVEFVDRHDMETDDGDLVGDELDRRRYSQEVIPPGVDLHLLGGAQPVDGADGTSAERLALRRDEGSGEFIISDKEEGDFVSGYRWKAPVEMAIGLAFSAVGVFMAFV